MLIYGIVIPLHSTDLLYMPRYENPVCLGAKCRMREWKASREKVWCCGDSCLTSFSKEVLVTMLSNFTAPIEPAKTKIDR